MISNALPKIFVKKARISGFTSRTKSPAPPQEYTKKEENDLRFLPKVRKRNKPEW